MTILQADGTTEVTLHGPGQQNTPQIAALKGPASSANRGSKRRKPNTRRRPKNVNAARRRARRTKPESITCQRAKGQCLQRESPEDPVLHPAPPQISVTHQLVGGGGPRRLTETHGPTLDPTHLVSPDLEGGQGHIQDPEAFLGLEVGLCPDPDLLLTLGLDPGPDRDPGTDLGLHPERGVHPDPGQRGKPVNPNRSPRSKCRSFQTAQPHLSPDSRLLSRPLKVSL